MRGAAPLLCVAALACDAPEPAAAQAGRVGRAFAEQGLRAEERALRAAIDFTSPPRASDSLGPDPIDVAPMGADHHVGLLASPPEVVVLDAGLAVVARAAAPARPTALVADPERGLVHVASELGPKLAAFRWAGSALARDPARDLDVAPLTSVTDVAAGPGGCVHAVGELDDVLVSRCGEATAVRAVEAGPRLVAAAGGHLVVASAIGHALTAFRLDERGLPGPPSDVARRKGPLFGIAAIDAPGGAFLAAGAVEDRPLDRTGGFFGNIDSFVVVSRVAGGRFERLAEVDVSELGVVTPKGLGLRTAGTSLTVVVTGFGSEAAAEIVVDTTGPGEVSVRARSYAGLPGVARLAPAGEGTWLGADPLLDAWVTVTPRGATAAPAGPLAAGPTEDALRLGEALFYTTLMAPWQRSDGAHSRFTCETCHLDGGIDGRTHHTGRGDVRATTKPLRGLFNNAPHFTRALDEDTTEMVFAEFRVAAAATGHDGWFALSEQPASWLRAASWSSRVDGSPLGLRRALLGYLARTQHAPNPRAAGRAAFDERERAGADLFARACASCHAPRLVAADPSTEVPRERWEALVLDAAGGPIVWARDGYDKTGVEPYVHPDGARPTSLRRAIAKRPYFTNGSAASLEEVVRRARTDPHGAFFHDGAPPDASAFSEEDAAALVAFLRLL